MERKIELLEHEARELQKQKRFVSKERDDLLTTIQDKVGQLEDANRKMRRMENRVSDVVYNFPEYRIFLLTEQCNTNCKTA